MILALGVLKLSGMNPEIERLVNDMLVQGRLYVEAIKTRDEALVKCIKDNGPEADILWVAAAEAAEKAHAAYNESVAMLHALRQKR